MVLLRDLFYNIVLIAILREDDEIKILTKIYKSKKFIRQEERNFKSSGKFLNEDAERYINSYQRNYKFVYISTVSNSINQGALPTCKRGDFLKYYVQSNEVSSICIDNKWSPFLSNDDIIFMKSRIFANVGLDFIFSPFIILSKFFEKELTKDVRLYILNEKNALSLMIFKSTQLLFAGYLKINSNLDEIKIGGKKSGSDTDAIAKDLENLVSLDDIEQSDDIGDLDGGEQINEFLDESSVPTPMPTSGVSESSIESFGRGVEIYNFIKHSLEEFYKNSLYDSDFIQKILIADSTGLAKDIVKYIESEIMVTTEIKSIDIANWLCEITRLEVLE